MVKLERAKKKDGRFLNPVPTRLGDLKLILKLIPMYVKNKAETVPRVALGPFQTDVSVYEQQPGSGLRVTWFGHASALLEIDGLRVLVDPVWDERAGPTRWAGPKRFFAPTFDLSQMPEIDVILISHDHYDHLGKMTVRHVAKLMPSVRWVTTAGVAATLYGFGVERGRVTELDWTESTVVHGAVPGNDLRVTAVPARHFSGRSLWDRNRSLWAGFVLEGRKHTVLCGGDSGWWEGFAAIGEQYGPFDLTMIEIGAYHELWKSIHLGPDGAADAFEALGAAAGAGLMMPIHWGLFNLALHGWRDPMERLIEVCRDRGIQLFAPTPGVPTEVVRGAEVSSDWWRVQGLEGS